MSEEFALRPYQEVMVERHLSLLATRGVSCDCSETGVGKTAVAMSVAKKLEVLPVIVVCPKTLKSHWRMWAKELGFQKGQVAVAGWEETKLGKYPQVYNRTQGWFEGVPHPREILIIFDEAHRAKSHKSQNSYMVRAAVQSGAYLYLISATLVQSTLDLGGLAYPLKLISSPRLWFPFAQQFGAGLNQFSSYHDFASPAQLKQLHLLLDSLRVRVCKRDITTRTLCLNQVDLIDSGHLKEINQMYDDLQKKIAELKAKEASAADEMVIRLRARQHIELAKVSTFVEEAVKHLQEGAKVCLFFNFTGSVEEAVRQFDILKYTARSITGQTPLADRESHIQAFNKGFLHVLILNIQAGSEGISLHDTTGEYPRVSLISPPESATTLVQAMGRIDRIGSVTVGLNRVIFIAGTAEEAVYNNVRRKINKLNTISDGDMAVRL
jgi:superfamily II DNA or RNA helicase